eukprot:gb/GEZN01015774.1/.p1 GENE.gb/GEZN01015774.1/~~gb/GEZN01015774.1/.p1  ORF type:complete len:159 (+),score=32.45 gb/GEZN01015774.1/:26-502(+)
MATFLRMLVLVAVCLCVFLSGVDASPRGLRRLPQEATVVNATSDANKIDTNKTLSVGDKVKVADKVKVPKGKGKDSDDDEEDKEKTVLKLDSIPKKNKTYSMPFAHVTAPPSKLTNNTNSTGMLVNDTQTLLGVWFGVSLTLILILAVALAVTLRRKQ